MFYAIWFLCLGMVVQGREVWGIAIVLAFLVGHFAFSKNRPKELLVLFLTVLIGFCLDSAYIVGGVISYSTVNPLADWAAPFWILSMYALFATTIDYSLSWIQQTPGWMRAVLGAGGGVASYVAGERMGVADFLLPQWGTVIILALVWAWMFPILYWLNDRLNTVLPSKKGW